MTPQPEKRPRGRPRLTEAERLARGSLVRRAARPEHDARHPLLVTLWAKRDVPSLRAKERFLRLRDALHAASDRLGMRVVHFAVLDDHVHLIIEARDKQAVSRGMQGLIIRVAKAINRGERSGKVFRDRYDAKVLSTPLEVRDAIARVLFAARRQARPRKLPAPAYIDPCSSGYWFDGWRGDVRKLQRAAEHHLDFPAEPPVAAPRTALLRAGWRRLGLIDPSDPRP